VKDILEVRSERTVIANSRCDNAVFCFGAIFLLLLDLDAVVDVASAVQLR